MADRGNRFLVDWIEVNQAYHDFEEAYQNLPADDDAHI